MRKYDAYVINLDSATDRWAHMQSEFEGTLLNLIRFPAVYNKVGWQGCGESYVKIVKEHMKKDPEFTGELLIILEDDIFRLQDVDVFNERCEKIFKYLEENRGSYSHFQGGGIFPQGFSVKSRDPLILGCDYITSTLFNVFGKDAATTILKWDTDRIDTIDNYLGNHNRGKMLAPFPHLVWQIIGIPSHIGNAAYTKRLNDQFRKTHKVMSQFVKSQPGLNFAKLLGGGRRVQKRKQKRTRRSTLKRRKTQKRKHV
jgi:hypothetical protein